MAQFNIPYQNLSANIPDEGVPLEEPREWETNKFL